MYQSARKEIKDMTKNGLITAVKACKQHEEQYLSAMLRLHKMKKEINILTDT